MNREDFPIFNNNIIYLDNSATSLKPECVIEKMVDYYKNYSANAHRGDYDISYKVDTEYENARKIVADFLNANVNEVIFTSGATDSLNIIARSFADNILSSGDEVLITKMEHASNVLPWFYLQQTKHINVNYIDLNYNYEVTLENVKKAVTKNTKIIALALVTNTIGDVRPLKEIIEFAHENNIYVVVDGAQGIPHMTVDVKDMDIDFLAFSAHKCYGPTGLGVLYGKENLLKMMKPNNLGGGMNEEFDSYDKVVLKNAPFMFEAGTQNIASVIAFGEAIKYINKIGMKTIHDREVLLKKQLVSKLDNYSHITVYNKNTDSGLVLFNVDGIFPQDVAYYLNKYHICVRAGNHCAKLTKDILGVRNTVRISIGFYNTPEEISKVAELLSDKERILREMI